MITTEPRVNPDGLYESRQACAALAIAASTLNKYTALGYCKASTRRCNGRRIWKGSELIRLWRFIY